MVKHPAASVVPVLNPPRLLCKVAWGDLIIRGGFMPGTKHEPDREELAWAGGFFCGEGCSTLRTIKSTSKHYRTREYKRIHLSVAQTSNGGVPAVLLRLQKAVGGLGHINGPYKPKTPKSKPYYSWNVAHFTHVQAIIAMLWPWLSPEKQAQAKYNLGIAVECSRRSKLKTGPKEH